MKVEITGCVYDAKGELAGIVDLPEQEAERLLALKAAKPVPSEIVQVQVEAKESSPAPKKPGNRKQA